MAACAMLGMYDMPGVDTANDALWAAIRAALGHGPDRLTRDRDVWDIWRDPGLILAQTCGFPYRAQLHGTVHKLATPDYVLPDCPPGYYRSVFVVQSTSDMRELKDCSGRIFAFNDALSQSGWAAPQHALRSAGVQVGQLLETGGHAASLAAVARGVADVTSVDLHSYRLLQHTGACPDNLRVIAQTDPTPSLPYICGLTQDAGVIRAALTRALGTPGAEALGLQGLVDIPDKTYLAVPTPPSPAQSRLPLRQLPPDHREL
ncbi:MAG: PhnD/SsuA/transferrin family substrate-binding protein [Pseudomonadota bacterium]